MAGESPVARVVGRNGHDGSRAVAGQHVVGDIDRNGASGEGIHGVGTRRYAAHMPCLGDALALRTFLGALDILLDGGAVLARRQVEGPFVLGGDDHEGHAENRVGTRGENLQFAVAALDVEEDLRTDRAADPVALNLLERVAPGQRVESVQHALGVGRHAQQPLLHALLLHGVSAADRKSVAHLVVGQHGTQFRAPVDHRVGAERQTVVLQHLLPAGVVPAVPFVGREVHFGRAGGVQPFVAAFGEGLDELRDGSRLLRIVAVVVVVHLQEGPLRPLVVAGIARADLAVPVERETDLVQLLAVAGDVALGGHGRMLPRLDGVLLGRKAEGVVAHRVQHVEALLPLVAGIDVRCDITQRVTYVQTRSRGIGEHVEYVEFRPCGVDFDVVGFIVPPALLPAGFDLSEVVFHSLMRSLFALCKLFNGKGSKKARIFVRSGLFFSR